MKKDTVEYVITIRSEDGSSGGGGGSSSSSGSGSGSKKKKGAANTKDGFDILGLLKNKKVMFGLATTGLVADTVITTSINRVDIRTGQTTLAQKMAFEYSLVKSGLAIGTTLVIGAATGNPLMMLGGVVAGASKIAQIGIAQENINLKRQVEDIGIGMTNIRAGASAERLARFGY